MAALAAPGFLASSPSGPIHPGAVAGGHCSNGNGDWSAETDALPCATERELPDCTPVQTTTAAPLRSKHGPSPTASSRAVLLGDDATYYCTQCLCRCDSGWDVIAGVHTGHTVLPLPVALEVLPAAVSKRVQSALEQWAEAHDKPRRAQAQQLDEQQSGLLRQRSQQRIALAELLAALAETEGRLAATAEAKALAACNWRYQQTRMEAVVAQWLEGCGRLRVEVAAAAALTPTDGTAILVCSGGSDGHAWAPSWPAAARELDRATALLAAQAGRWAAEHQERAEAAQRLERDCTEQQQKAEGEGGTSSPVTGGSGPPITVTLPFSFSDSDCSAAAVVARCGALGGLLRTQPHQHPSPVPRRQQRQERDNNRHPLDSGNGDATVPFTGGPSSPSPPEVEDGNDSGRAERRRQLAAKEATLQQALDNLLAEPRETEHNNIHGGNGDYGRGSGSASSSVSLRDPPSNSRPHHHYRHQQQARAAGGTGGGSEASSLSSLQQQLLDELLREGAAEHMNRHSFRGAHS